LQALEDLDTVANALNRVEGYGLSISISEGSPIPIPLPAGANSILDFFSGLFSGPHKVFNRKLRTKADDLPSQNGVDGGPSST
jgi:hypothetical protein